MGDRAGSASPTRSKAKQGAFEDGPSELPGRSHGAGERHRGARAPREMVAGPPRGGRTGSGLQADSSTYFVELTLSDASGDVASRNVYWLSTAAERLAWRASTWFFTPTKTYADFTSLADLPTTRPTVSVCADAADGTGSIRVVVTNDGDDVAFFVRVRLAAGPNGHDVTPVSWSDGYVTLMPGEERTLTASYRTADLHGAEPSVDVSGWNVPASRPAIEDCA